MLPACRLAAEEYDDVRKILFAFDGNGRLTGPVLQTAPHLIDTPATFAAVHSDTTRNTTLNVPGLKHTDDRLTEHGQGVPYVRPERREILLIKRLQQFVPDALPVVRKASWHCRQCQHDYYGERYCTHCHTGHFARRQWLMNGLKNGAGITPGDTLSVPTLRSAEISGSVSAFPVVAG